MPEPQSLAVNDLVAGHVKIAILGVLGGQPTTSSRSTGSAFPSDAIAFVCRGGPMSGARREVGNASCRHANCPAEPRAEAVDLSAPH
jgi:hypothetical protein